MAKAMPALAAVAVAARVALARLRLLAAAAAARLRPLAPRDARADAAAAAAQLRTLAPRDARADAAADKNEMCEGSVHKGARGLPYGYGQAFAVRGARSFARRGWRGGGKPWEHRSLSIDRELLTSARGLSA